MTEPDDLVAALQLGIPAMQFRDKIRSFAAAIRADQRERDAKVCEIESSKAEMFSGERYGARLCAAAIREGK